MVTRPFWTSHPPLGSTITDPGAAPRQQHDPLAGRPSRVIAVASQPRAVALAAMPAGTRHSLYRTSSGCGAGHRPGATRLTRARNRTRITSSFEFKDMDSLVHQARPTAQRLSAHVAGGQVTVRSFAAPATAVAGPAGPWRTAGVAKVCWMPSTTGHVTASRTRSRAVPGPAAAVAGRPASLGAGRQSPGDCMTAPCHQPLETHPRQAGHRVSATNKPTGKKQGRLHPPARQAGPGRQARTRRDKLPCAS